MSDSRATPPLGTAQQFDVRVMGPNHRHLAAMILADATPEGTEEAALRVIEQHEATEGSAIFIAYLSGMPIAAFILTPAQMSIEMPLIAVRKEIRGRGIGKVIALDAVRRAGNRPVVTETPESALPFFTAIGFKKFGRRKGPNGELRWRVGWHTPGMRTPTGQEQPSNT
ncbi:MAG TPA: GNAT family N-acetyltransferase [Thermomicrobiales bacterium]|nr:GNAT family N-acetyltransferase [Thermomicrobiales bacterium]